MSEVILLGLKTQIKKRKKKRKKKKKKKKKDCKKITLAGIKPVSPGWETGTLTTTLNDIVESEDLIIIHIRQRRLLSTNCKICIEDYICRDDFCHFHLSILTNGVFPRRYGAREVTFHFFSYCVLSNYYVVLSNYYVVLSNNYCDISK